MCYVNDDQLATSEPQKWPSYAPMQLYYIPYKLFLYATPLLVDGGEYQMLFDAIPM